MFFCTFSGNHERGWNDPPVFLASHPLSKPPQVAPPRRNPLLTKRVAHPDLCQTSPAQANFSCMSDKVVSNSLFLFLYESMLEWVKIIMLDLFSFCTDLYIFLALDPLLGGPNYIDWSTLPGQVNKAGNRRLTF